MFIQILMITIQKNIQKCQNKILIVFGDMIANIFNNGKFEPIVTESFIPGGILNISVIFLMLRLLVMKISGFKNWHFSYKPILNYKCNKLHNRLITFSKCNALYLINTNTHSSISHKKVLQL